MYTFNIFSALLIEFFLFLYNFKIQTLKYNGFFNFLLISLINFPKTIIFKLSNFDYSRKHHFCYPISFYSHFRIIKFALTSSPTFIKNSSLFLLKNSKKFLLRFQKLCILLCIPSRKFDFLNEGSPLFVRSKTNRDPRDKK